MISKSFYLSLIILSFYSCSAQEKEFMSNDIDQLKNHIQLALSPVSVQWSKANAVKTKGRAIGPSDYNLMAIITLSSDDWQTLHEEYKNSSKINDRIYLDQDFVKEWFSPAVRKEFYNEDDFYRISKDVYSAEKFAKSPLLNGFIFLAEENQVFVYLYTN